MSIKYYQTIPGENLKFTRLGTGLMTSRTLSAWWVQLSSACRIYLMRTCPEQRPRNCQEHCITTLQGVWFKWKAIGSEKICWNTMKHHSATHCTSLSATQHTLVTIHAENMILGGRGGTDPAVRTPGPPSLLVSRWKLRLHVWGHSSTEPQTWKEKY